MLQINKTIISDSNFVWLFFFFFRGFNWHQHAFFMYIAFKGKLINYQFNANKHLDGFCRWWASRFKWC